MHEIPNYGVHIKLKEFYEGIKHSVFTDWDGFAKLATETQESDIIVFPGDVLTQDFDPKFTHVVWYNK